MGSCPHDTALVQYDDLVSLHDAGNTLSHHHDDGVARVLLKHPAKLRIRLKIQGRKGIVKHIDIRPTNQRPCDGQTLALAAGCMLYVTYYEILPQVTLMEKGRRPLVFQLAGFLLGFVLISIM